MTSKLLSLFGLAPKEIQAAGPPLLAYILLPPAAYFGAELIETATFLIQWGSFGYATRWGVSVTFRTLGLIGGILLVHGVVRALVYGDDLSLAGWIRKRLVGGN